jgi:hypothetical protein
VHTRALSLLTPGIGMLCGLHAPHTTYPQHLQHSACACSIFKGEGKPASRHREGKESHRYHTIKSHDSLPQPPISSLTIHCHNHQYQVSRFTATTTNIKSHDSLLAPTTAITTPLSPLLPPGMDPTTPTHRQWCFLLIVVKSASQSVHVVTPPCSIHVGCSTSPAGTAAAAVAVAVVAALLLPKPKNPPPEVAVAGSGAAAGAAGGAA